MTHRPPVILRFLGVLIFILGWATCGVGVALADAMWWRPLPFADIDRLFLVVKAFDKSTWRRDLLSANDQSMIISLAANREVAAFSVSTSTLDAGPMAGTRVNVANVSPMLLEFLGYRSGAVRPGSVFFNHTLSNSNHSTGATISVAGHVLKINGALPATFGLPRVQSIDLVVGDDSLLSSGSISPVRVIVRANLGETRAQLAGVLNGWHERAARDSAANAGLRWDVAPIAWFGSVHPAGAFKWVAYVGLTVACYLLAAIVAFGVPAKRLESIAIAAATGLLGILVSVLIIRLLGNLFVQRLGLARLPVIDLMMCSRVILIGAALTGLAAIALGRWGVLARALAMAVAVASIVMAIVIGRQAFALRTCGSFEGDILQTTVSIQTNDASLGVRAKALAELTSIQERIAKTASVLATAGTDYLPFAMAPLTGTALIGPNGDPTDIRIVRAGRGFEDVLGLKSTGHASAEVDNWEEAKNLGILALPESGFNGGGQIAGANIIVRGESSKLTGVVTGLPCSWLSGSMSPILFQPMHLADTKPRSIGRVIIIRVASGFAMTARDELDTALADFHSPETFVSPVTAVRDSTPLVYREPRFQLWFAVCWSLGSVILIVCAMPRPFARIVGRPGGPSNVPSSPLA